MAASSSVRSYHKTSYHRRTSTFPMSTMSPTNGQHLRHFPEDITPSNLTSGLSGFCFMKFSAGGRCPTQVLTQDFLQGWTSNEVESGQILNGDKDGRKCFLGAQPDPTPVPFLEHPGTCLWGHLLEILSTGKATFMDSATTCPEHGGGHSSRVSIQGGARGSWVWLPGIRGWTSVF